MNTETKVKTISTKEIKNDRSIENRTIDYLRNNKNILIEKGFEYLINIDENDELYKNSDELYDFQNDEELQEQFKISIEGHFDWIMAHCDNKYSEEARFKHYKDSDIELFDIYCFFYDFLINRSSIEIEPPSLKKTLKAYFSHLKDKIYCVEE